MPKFGILCKITCTPFSQIRSHFFLSNNGFCNVVPLSTSLPHNPLFHRFTPDFTLSRISNTLRIQTSDGTEMLFPLLAVLPHYMLAACYAMQPRPEWEKRMAWFSVPFWLFALLALLIAVLVRTNFYVVPVRPSYHSDTELPTLQATGGPIFDLSSLTRSVHATLSQKISALRARWVGTEVH